MQKDSFIMGFVLGAICPVLGYMLIDFIFQLLTHYGLMEAVSVSTSGRRFRTVLLFSICCNLIPFQWSKKNRWDDTLRGIVIPTLIYVGFWLFKFYTEIF
ncbi:MAG: hypothetical protein WAT79_02890 [Saprospiraceae bacterium]